MPSAGSMRVSPRVSPMLRLPLMREGIVAAGIEDEDHGRGALLLQPVREAARCEGGIAHQALFAWACLGHVDREKVIGAIDGEAVAGEIDERGVAALDLAFELDQRPAHGAASDVLGRDHVEAELGELLRDGARVVHRLFQRRHVLVSVVADDERHALCGIGWRREHQAAKESSETESPNLACRVLHAALLRYPRSARNTDEARSRARGGRCRSGPGSRQDRR